MSRARSWGSDEEEEGCNEYGDEEEAMEGEFDRELDRQMLNLQRQAKRMRAENSVLLHAQLHIDRQVRKSDCPLKCWKPRRPP